MTVEVLILYLSKSEKSTSENVLFSFISKKVKISGNLSGFMAKSSSIMSYNAFTVT